MKNLVYCIRFPCGRLYFGLTNDFERRKRLHIQKARGGTPWRVCQALRDCNYNVTWEIIQDNLTLDEASYLEISLISEYKTQSLDHGFNMTPGGHEKSGPLSTEHRQKIRDSCGAIKVVAIDSGTGQMLGNWDSLSSASKETGISLTCVRQISSDYKNYQSNGYCFGRSLEEACENRKKHIERVVRVSNRKILRYAKRNMPRPEISEETRQKRSKSVIATMNSNEYKEKLRESKNGFWVYCIGTGTLVGHFKLVMDAVEQCGLTIGSINNAIAKRQSGSSAVINDRYLIRLDDDNGKEARKTKPYRRTFEVRIGDKIVATYRSAKKAEKDFHIAAKTIRECIRTGKPDRDGRTYQWIN